MARFIRAPMGFGLALLVGCSAGSPDPEAAAVPLDAAPRDAAPWRGADASADQAGVVQDPTVFLILLENKDWSWIEGNTTSAPYLNGLLTQEAAYCTDFHNALGDALHPSEPNYLTLEGGATLGVVDNEVPAANCQRGVDHLTAQLDRRGIRWRSYQEGVSGLDCPLVNDGLYVPRHNPMVYFDDVSGPDCADTQSKHCIDTVRPFGELADDLRSGDVGRYNFLTPDLCNSAHDDCTGDAIRQGDDWLRKQIPLLQGSEAYRQGGIVFITWDEGGVGNHPIGLVVLSNDAAHGPAPCTGASHASVLRTIQTILGVGPYLRDAADVPDLAPLFVHPLQ